MLRDNTWRIVYVCDPFTLFYRIIKWRDQYIRSPFLGSLESLSDSNLLVQSLVSTNSTDSLSLMMPTTSLFPSLVNIQDDGLSSTFNHLDALNNIMSDHPAPRAHEAEDAFLCDGGGSFMSDDDSGMPTIKSVQSITNVTTYAVSEVSCRLLKNGQRLYTNLCEKLATRCTLIAIMYSSRHLSKLYRLKRSRLKWCSNKCMKKMCHVLL